MEMVWSYIGKTVTYLGGGALVILGTSKWISKVIADRLNLEWKSKSDKELEKIKAQLIQNQSIMNAAITNLSSGHQAANERRLKAIEIIWSNILNIRNLCTPAIFFYSILLPKEYNAADILEKPTFQSILSQLNMDKISEQINKI